MKTYNVNVNGSSYVLKYTLDDREELEDMFPRKDGTPGALGDLVVNHMIGAGSTKVQQAILWAGLRHLDPEKWTLAKVKNIFSKASESTEGVKPLNTAAFKAILASGVLGVAKDPEPEGKEESPEA